MSRLSLCHRLICCHIIAPTAVIKIRALLTLGKEREDQNTDFVNIVIFKGSKHSGRTILANIIEVCRHNLKTNSPRHVTLLGLVRESLSNFVQIVLIFYSSANSSKQYCTSQGERLKTEHNKLASLTKLIFSSAVRKYEETSLVKLMQ